MIAVTSSSCPFDAQYGDVKVAVHDKDKSLTIEVETLRLRILSVNSHQHNASLIDLYGSKKVNALVGSGATLEAHAVQEKVMRWNKRWSEKNPYAGYVVVEKETGDFVGQVIIKPLKDKAAGPGKFVDGVAEIGYLTMDKHWGKKYAQEFTHAMLSHLLPKLIESGYQIQGHRVTSVMATARTDNIASNMVLRKFMTHTGTKERYNGLREWYELKV